MLIVPQTIRNVAFSGPCWATGVAGTAENQMMVGVATGAEGVVIPGHGGKVWRGFELRTSFAFLPQLHQSAISDEVSAGATTGIGRALAVDGFWAEGTNTAESLGFELWTSSVQTGTTATMRARGHLIGTFTWAPAIPVSFSVDTSQFLYCVAVWDAWAASDIWSADHWLAIGCVNVCFETKA